MEESRAVRDAICDIYMEMDEGTQQVDITRALLQLIGQLPKEEFDQVTSVESKKVCIFIISECSLHRKLQKTFVIRT